MMRQVLPPPRRVHVVLAKLSGATMWCWILWRLKHDWRDVFVSCTPVGRGLTTPRRLNCLCISVYKHSFLHSKAVSPLSGSP